MVWRTNRTADTTPKSSPWIRTRTSWSRIQNALDEGGRHDWHLVGVSDVMAEHGVILFWDTERPSFGISHR